MGALGLIATLWVMFQILRNFQPGSNKIEKDLQKMKAEIQPWTDELVPWTHEEMELLSQRQINKSVKKGISKEVKGVLISVYNEPLAAYSYKKYLGDGPNAILFVRTSKQEFVFRFKKKGAELTINNQKVARVDQSGKLFSLRNGQLIAELARDEDELILPIRVGNKEVGALLKPQQAMKVNPRAFEFLNEMEETEETLSLAIALKELVNAELPENLQY